MSSLALLQLNATLLEIKNDIETVLSQAVAHTRKEQIQLQEFNQTFETLRLETIEIKTVFEKLISDSNLNLLEAKIYLEEFKFFLYGISGVVLLSFVFVLAIARYVWKIHQRSADIVFI